MKISIAQIQPAAGDIQGNIGLHKTWIERAIAQQADFIAFPELSLTAYEPKLARELAIGQDDFRVEEFQKISDRSGITIGLGAPTKSGRGIHISMIVFQPHQGRTVYSKQILHRDEKPFFVEGQEPLLLTIGDKKVLPAICYESLQKEHAKHIQALGSDIYLASVAKPQKGIEKAFDHYREIAAKFSVSVLLTNSIGHCDDFQSAGQSAVWGADGTIKDKLKADTEGLLIWDTETETVLKQEAPKVYS
ncbi:MAG: carbon-nitrogen hydrolase family protein [bacterium]|nr:carbon-nitrogen hydrolase family protein [bacterium]